MFLEHSFDTFFVNDSFLKLFWETTSNWITLFGLVLFIGILQRTFCLDDSFLKLFFWNHFKLNNSCWVGSVHWNSSKNFHIQRNSNEFISITGESVTPGWSKCSGKWFQTQWTRAEKELQVKTKQWEQISTQAQLLFPSWLCHRQQCNMMNKDNVFQHLKCMRKNCR